MHSGHCIHVLHSSAAWHLDALPLCGLGTQPPTLAAGLTVLTALPLLDYQQPARLQLPRPSRLRLPSPTLCATLPRSRPNQPHQPSGQQGHQSCQARPAHYSRHCCMRSEQERASDEGEEVASEGTKPSMQPKHASSETKCWREHAQFLMHGTKCTLKKADCPPANEYSIPC